jgi:small subunit ribosomal protein S11
MAYKKKLKKQKRHVDAAIVHVKSSFNNTLVTVSAINGDVLSRGSAGALGFRGSRKGTPFVASQIASNLAKDMKVWGVKNVEVNLQGPGSGRDSVVRALQASGLSVTVIRDVTPLPHNGCRPAKKRRV